MSRLITSTLFNSIDWYKNCPPDRKEKALNDLTDTLARIWNKPNESVKRGMDFEKLLYSVLEMDKEEKMISSNFFRTIARACKGGIFQKKIKKFIEIDGTEYCLFGKVDVWFPDIIKDIKTTGNYKGRDSYLKGMQHKLYCYIEHIKRFEYIVAEFTGLGGPIVNVHTIPYEVENWNGLEEEIIKEVRKAMSFLREDTKLFDLYATKYCLY